MDYRASPWPKCKHAPCTNPGRYTSGYCGIHDDEFNGGAGEKIERSIPRCKTCGVELYGKYYSDVPTLGGCNLCIACWARWETRNDGTP